MTDVKLTWEDNAFNESTYHVERQVDGGGYVEIADNLPPDTILYIDSPAPFGTLDYRVRCRNVAGFSGYSNVAQVFVADTRVIHDALTDTASLPIENHTIAPINVPGNGWENSGTFPYTIDATGVGINRPAATNINAAVTDTALADCRIEVDLQAANNGKGLGWRSTGPVQAWSARIFGGAIRFSEGTTVHADEPFTETGDTIMRVVMDGANFNITYGTGEINYALGTSGQTNTHHGVVLSGGHATPALDFRVDTL